LGTTVVEPPRTIFSLSIHIKNNELDVCTRQQQQQQQQQAGAKGDALDTAPHTYLSASDCTHA
jgi:hypothetical protein